MSSTLGLTGMDPDTEVALKIAFAEANARLDERWVLVPDSEADHVLVDMDSMYGPMSWLRLHAAGKTVIGLTSVARTQTEFRLSRPFDADQVHDLLLEVEAHAPASIGQDDASTTADAAGAADAEETEVGDDTDPTHAQPSAVPGSGPEGPGREDARDAGDGDGEIAADTATPTLSTPEAPARDPVFADWMRRGALTGRVRYRRGDGPTLLIDTNAQTWHGPSALKLVAPAIAGTVEEDAFEPVDDDNWVSEHAAAGESQPLQRLAWLAGLVSGQGALLPEHDAAGRFALTKWPQTEREYPKHFRIATAMMKGPATVAEIAEASSVPAADVADFINANLVTGFAENVPEPTPEPVDASKKSSGGLLGRLRNR